MRFNEEIKNDRTVHRILAIEDDCLALFLYELPDSPKTQTLKKLLSSLAIIGIILVSNCSRIPENNNPVIGIWIDVEVSTSEATSTKQTVRQEWIFNDAYLGRYHEKTNGSITFKTDFRWSYENEIYTITYPDTDREEEMVSMESSDDTTMLADVEGNVMATRE